MIKRMLNILKNLPDKTKNHWSLYDISLICIIAFFNLIITPIVQKYNPIGIPLVTSWDGIIPLIPFFVIPYVLFTPFLIFTVFLVRKDVKFRQSLLTAYALTTIVSFIFYIFYQTSMIRPEINPFGVLNTILHFVYTMDAPLNAFPSLHVGLTTCALFFLRNKWVGWYIFGLSIIASTVFVKQHFLLDVLGGLIIAFVCIPIAIVIVSRYVKPNDKRELKNTLKL